MEAWRVANLEAAPKERLWKASSTSAVAKIAVRIRRGDVKPSGKWSYRFIPDKNAYLQLIALCKNYLSLKNHHAFEVHIFSEDYGVTNWTAFESNNTYFHLAPRDTTSMYAPGNLTANLRDWAHFTEADILIAGGTFSVVPALARPSSAANSLPLTIFHGNNYGYLSSRWYPQHWLPWSWTGQNRTEVMVKFS